MESSPLVFHFDPLTTPIALIRATILYNRFRPLVSSTKFQHNMKPTPLYMIFFLTVPSFATTADHNSSTSKVLKKLNAISGTATVVHDQVFKHNATLSDLKRIGYPSDHYNRLVEKRDGVGKAVNETFDVDEHGKFITEKRGNLGDFLYKLFGLPDRYKANGENHGNATPERRNDNGKVSSTMCTMIESRDSNEDKHVHRQENRFLFNHIDHLNLALEQLERREPVKTATKMRSGDRGKRETTVETLPYSPQPDDDKHDHLGPIFSDKPVGHGPRIPTSGKPYRRRVLTTLQAIPKPSRSPRSFASGAI